MKTKKIREVLKREHTIKGKGQYLFARVEGKGHREEPEVMASVF